MSGDVAKEKDYLLSGEQNEELVTKRLDELKRAEEKLKRLYRYHNTYNKTHYERFSLLLPEGTKERIKALGYTSMNAIIVHWILSGLAEEEANAQQPSNADQDV